MDDNNRLAKIEGWVRQLSQESDFEKYDDLHIDEIDLAWEDRSLWFDGSVWAFRAAVCVRNRLTLPLSVGLGISLSPDEPALSADMRLGDLISHADEAPPSLYLFERGKEPGSDALDSRFGEYKFQFSVQDIPDARVGIIQRFKSAYSDKYYRSAFLLG